MTRRPSLLRPFPVLRCEELEDRRTPTTFTWTGGGGLNTNWSLAANWSTPSGPAAPTGLVSEHDDLVFPQLINQTTVLTTTNDIVGGVFNSISFSSTLPVDGYTLTGTPLTLGSPGVTGSGLVTVNAGSVNNTIGMTITLGASAGSDQFFTVQAAAALNITGQLKDSLGSSLTQEGPGTLTLSSDNQGFTGPIKLDNIVGGGTVVVAHANALGGTSSPGTTVASGATLAIAPNIGTVQTPLRLNGQGATNTGALLNLGGTNTWAGPIILDSDAAIGAAPGTLAAPSVLNITGVIGDTGAGRNLFKEGDGEVQLNSPTGNTYRGTTTVDDGILSVGTATGLGFNTTPPGFPDPRNGVVVNSTLTGAGQLRLLSINGTGFTVVNKYLTLNGSGIGGPSPNPQAVAHPGAITSALGTNTWAGPVILGSPLPQTSTSVQVAGYPNTNLIISGPISSPNANLATNPFTLVKVDAGTVILNNANTYVGGTVVTQGILDIRDSQALGSGAVNVNTGATLQLDVEAGLPAGAPGNQRFADGQDPGAPPGPRDLWNDSVTGDANKLRIANSLTIHGLGVNNGGALRSATGINTWTGPIVLGGPENLQDSIGVDLDPRNGHPTPSSSYLTDDYSLTVTGVISGDLTVPTTGSFNDFVKTGLGNLILPTDNAYTGFTRVQQGWITVRSNRALGGLDMLGAAGNGGIYSSTGGFPVPIPGGLADPLQPGVFVSAGAAVHVLAPAGGSLTIPQNIYLAGTGPTLPYSFISQKGALVNLDGNNIWSGIIGLIGSTGIGVVETVPGSATGSSLRVTGAVVDGKVSYRFINDGTGGAQYFPIDTFGATTGTLHVYYDPLGSYYPFGIPTAPTTRFAPNPPLYPTTVRVYDLPPALPPKRIYDSGPVPNANVLDIPLGTLSTASIQFAMNEGAPVVNPVTTGRPNTNYTWVVPEVSIPFTGGLVKLGFGQLALQGAGTYSQATDVLEGTLLVQGNTSLGLSSSGTATGQQTFNPTPTTVQSGAVLQFGQTNPALNGGIQNGVQLTNEQLILNGPAQQIAVAGDQSPAPGTFTLTFNGQTTAPIPTGASAAEVQAALSLLSSIRRSAINTVQVLGTGGAFTLTFNGQTTGVLAFNATAGQVQAALDALPTIGGVGGSVVVTAAAVPGGVQYTITFGGTLGFTNQPQITATPVTFTAAITVPGTSTASQVQTVSDYITDGAFTLTFNGSTTGPLTFNASAGQVQSALNALPTIGGAGGTVAVTSTVIPGGVQYTITFGGTLANAAQPLVTASPLPVSSRIVQNGSPTQLNAQTVQVFLTAATSTFQLTFNGASTGNLPVGSTAAAVQAALNALPTIGGAGGTVTVGQSALLPGGTQYTVTFNGSLGHTTLPPITATGTGYFPLVGATTAQTGLGGTATVVEVPAGGMTRYDVTFGGDLANTNLPIMGSAEPTAAVATVQPGGPTQSAVQTATVLLVYGNFTLTFNGQTTAPLRPNDTAANVQAALNALPYIQANGSVVVTATPVPGGTQYTITFGGGLANTALPQMTITANGQSLPGVSITTAGTATTSQVQSVVELASKSTFTLSYKGQTTAPIPITATAAQTQAAINTALTNLKHDNADTPVTVTRAGNVFFVLFVPKAADVAALAAAPSSAAPFVPELTVSGVTTVDGNPSLASLITQYAAVQVLQVPTSGTFTLTFGGQTTAPIAFNASAAQIQAALNALSTIGTGGGFVTVYQTAAGFTITFGGALANSTQPLITTTGGATVTPGPNAYDYLSRGPLTLNSGTRIASSANSRLSVLGAVDDANNEIVIATVQAGSATQSAVQTVQVFGAGGAFTLSFNGTATIPLPYNATAAQVQDALNTLSTLGGVGGVVTVTATPLPGGTQYTVTFGSSLANTSVPPLTGTSLSLASAVKQTGGPGQSGVQTVSVFLTSGAFLLTFNGQTTAPIPFNATPSAVQAALTALPTIGGVGGAVTVTAAVSTAGTVYTITFGGALANKAVPQVVATYNGADLVKRGGGELLLGGNNSYRGTTWIDQGIVTAANSQALGATTNGVVVAASAQLQLQGNLTIAGKQLTVQGTGVTTPSSLTNQWFNVGPAPTNNGQSPQNLPTSARIVNVAADPTDPDVIYIATAGGGAWKTIDRGHHWTPLFDSSVDPRAVMWGGAIAVAPTDPHTIYFGTGDAFGTINGSPLTGQADNFAGSGVYMSTDSGATWKLLTNPDGTNPLLGLAVTQMLVDPRKANQLFVGTSNIAREIVGGAHAGTLRGVTTALPGVYRYTPAQGWYNMTGPKAVSLARQNGNRFPGQGTGIPGQAPFDAQSSGSTAMGPPGVVGPDDDYRLAFPGYNGTVPQFAWTSLSLVDDTLPGLKTPDQSLYAALYLPGVVRPRAYAYPTPVNIVPTDMGQQFYEPPPAFQHGMLNAVYRTGDLSSDTPAWYVGDANRSAGDPPADSRQNEYPVGVIPDPQDGKTLPGRNGMIKVTTVIDPQTIGSTLYQIQNNLIIKPGVQHLAYAVNLYPDWQAPPYPGGNHVGELLDIQKSHQEALGWTNQDDTWAATGSVPAAPFGLDTPTSTALGFYSSAILAQAPNPLSYVDNPFHHVSYVSADPNHVYLAGPKNLWESLDGGSTWNAISLDSRGNGPGLYFHALALDMAGRLLTGSDGGIWQSSSAPPGHPTTPLFWSNLNGDLSIALLNSVDAHPTDLNQALAGAQNTGIQQLNAGVGTPPAWSGNQVTNLVYGEVLTNGGTVRYNPRNPLIQYAVVSGALFQSQNGGATWAKILDVTDPASGTVPWYNQFPLAVDPVNPNRVVVGGNSLQESRTGGSAGSFFSLAAPVFPFGPLTKISAVGLAQYQGQFAPDPGFPQVTDQLSNTYNPATIYVTDGTTTEVTKDEGVSWQNRTVAIQDKTYTITFGGSLGITPLPLMSVTTSGAFRGRVARAQVGQPPSPPPPPGGPTLNEVQTVELTGNGRTGDTFTLTFTNSITNITLTTAPIPYNATAAQVQAALNALLNIGPPFTQSAVQTITELSSGSTQPPANKPPLIAYGAYTVSFNGSAPSSPIAAGPAGIAVDALTLQGKLESLTTVGTGNVAVSASPVIGNNGVQYKVSFQGALANAAQPLINVTPLTVVAGQPTSGPGTVDTIDDYMTSGTFDITFTNSSNTTTTITEPWNVSFKQLETDLNNMAAIGGTTPASSVKVTINPDVNGIKGAEEYVITFTTGPLAAAGQGKFVVAPTPPAGVAVGAVAYAQHQVIGGTGSVGVTLSPIVPNIATVTSITVDPSNRDTVYLTESYPHGQAGPVVLRSTDAGQSWTDITGNGPTALPDSSAWSSVVDPRTGTLYVGNDSGVWQLPNAATAGTTPTNWSPAGAGMPGVRVTDLVLNQSLNTLSAATYGRGMFQLFLTNYQGNTGAALRAVSGSSIWTGPVSLAGPTTIAANGNQNNQNGITAASLNIIGSISDQTGGGVNNTLTFGTPSVGASLQNGSGTVILSGTNTYGGQTVVSYGVLEVNNPNALGAATPTGNTVVQAGAQLALESDLQAEPITLFGNGIPFSGHSTGALRNVSNNNTYTGQLTLGSNTTIGVDSGTSLTIGVKPGLAGIGAVLDTSGKNYTLDKELTGTLILAGADTYGGLTTVDQGALQVQNGAALGTAGAVVRDGAQMQIARNAVTLAPTVVPTTAGLLTLLGTGIFRTGALVNVRNDSNPTGSNDNTWAGPINFTDNPAYAGFSPATTPGSQVAIGVADSGVPGVVDTLTINTTIQDSAATPTSLGLIKVGPGRLTLAKANSYTGVTNVNTGSVRVQNPGSLGPTQASSAVQTISVIGTGSPAPNNTYQLSFEGFTTPVLISNNGNAVNYAAAVQAALNTIPILNGNVAVTGSDGVNSQSFTVTFTNALANIPVPVITATNVAAGVTVTVLGAQVGGTGVVVGPGAALELDGDPTRTGASLSVYKVLTVNGDGPAGTATVTAAPVAGGSVYTVALGGALGGAVLPPVTATGTGGATAVVTTPGIQAVQVTGNDGTFTLTFNGQTTAQIPYNATAAQVQAALNALSTINGTGFVSVTLSGVPTAPGGSTYLVVFGGGLAGSAQPQITAASVTAYTGLIQPGSISGSAQQSVTVGVGSTGGTFTLTFQGSTTAAIPFNATAAQLAAALNALPSIGGVGGSVTVALTGSFFTVTFGGSLANTNVPLLTVGSSAVSTTTVQAGGPGGPGIQAVTVTGSTGTFTLSFAGQTTAPLPVNATAAQVQAALTALSGIGGVVGPLGTQEGLGGLDNISGSNTYSGPVTLGALQNPNLPGGQSGASIGAVPGTTLTVNSVQDPTPLVAPAPQLQKVGQGTLVFPNANPYGGQTNVIGGVLRISNQFALGTTRQDIQTVTVTSPSFTLGFNGQTTTTLQQTDSFATVQAALTALLTSPASSASNYAGNLTIQKVTKSSFAGGVQFTIFFDPASNLGNTNLPALTATPSGGSGAAFTTISQAGNGPGTQNLQVTATNGTFTLTFNGLNGVPQSTQPLLYNVPPAGGVGPTASIQNALNALSNIGGVGGSVIVTQTGTANGPGGANYTITFLGTLANAKVPQLQASTTGGTTAVVTTLNDGPAGTTVQNGATLQITPLPPGGSLTMSPEVVTINGQGFNNQGALNVSGGTVLWNTNQLILGSNASVGTTSALTNDALTFNTPITDQGNGFNLDVYGPGTVTFQATGNNQYTGTTTVHAGTLTLAETGGTTAGGAIMGPLVVGDGSAPAVVRETLNNQVADTSSVTVNLNGTFDLNQKTDTIGALTVNNGTVLTGGTSNNGGQLTTGPVSMTGGVINVGAGGTLTSGSVTMTAGALIAAGANSTVTAGAVGMTNSSITLGNAVTLSAASLTLAGSTIGLAAGATGNETVSTTGAVSLSNLLGAASSISLGNNSTLTVGSSTPAALSLTGTGAAASSVVLGTGGKLTSGTLSVVTAPATAPASSVTLGNNGVWTVGAVTLDDGLVSTGTGLSAGTADVTMANGSTLQVGGGTVTSGKLKLTGGSTIALGAGTTDSSQSADLTGSTIAIGTGASLKLAGNLVATSTATTPSAVAGPGTLNFAGSNPTVAVAAGPGPDPVDLLISALLQVSGLGVTQLLKTGTGLLELNPAAAFAGLLNVQAGNVQVDSVTGPVALNGGTLSGAGSVGTIDNGATINPPGAIGTVSPGVGFGTTTAITVQGTPTTSQVQTVWDYLSAGSFTLTFGGQTTGALAFNASAAQVQTALNALSTVGGVGGSVAVTATAIPGGIKYTITFGGTLANTALPRITSSPPAQAGILTSTPAAGTDLFGAGTTFSVYLSNATNTHPAPVAGTDYSKLVVNGTLNLSGAVLDTGSLVGPGIQTNDTFTIISATQVNGTFSAFVNGTLTALPNGSGVFVAGQKFTITYTNTTVVLQKVRATATITSLVASTLTAEINQPVTITATVTPEAGAGSIPAADTVTFTLTPQSGPAIVVKKPKDPVTGNWVLNTQTDIPGGPLPAGTYAVTAVFDGDPSNFQPSPVVSLGGNLVVLQPSIGTLTAAATNVAPFGNAGYISPNNSPGVQDASALSVTVRQELSTTGYTVNVYNTPALSAAGKVRTFTGVGTASGTDVVVNTVWDGKNDAGAFVADGTYYVTLTFTDPWANTLTTGPASVVVDNTSPAAGAVGATAPVITPTPGTSVPTSVSLTDTVSDADLSGWTLNVYSPADPTHPVFVRTVSTTGVTSAAVNVTWNGTYNSPSFPTRTGQTVPDGQYLVTVTATDLGGNATTSATTPVFVFSSPSVTVTSGSPSVVYGQPVTFTATVSVPTQLATFVTGTQVQFFNGSTQLGTQTLTQTGTAGSFTTFQAAQTVPVLNAGTYTSILAVYPGNSNIPPGTSAPFTQVVTPAPITVTADNQTTTYGAALPPLTRTVTGLLPSDPGGGFTGALATAATPTSPVGQYQITQGTLKPDGNYTIQSFTAGTLTVTPAALTIVVNNADRVVGAPNPPFTFTAQGLVGSDTAAVVTGLTLSTTATQSSPVGTYPITAAGTPTAGANYTVVNVIPGVLSVTPQLTSFAVGSGGGGQATVNIYSAAGKLLNTIIPFPGFTGEVRTVQADFNHDGVLDIAVATGPGTAAQIKVIDGATGEILFVNFPFADFTGGAFVAAGDITGDGIPDLVVTPDQGGGPRVIAYSGATFAPIVSFFGINDPDFRGGARATLADINHDGFADLVVAAGFGGGPRISIGDGKALSSLRFVNLVADFFAYEPALRNGTYVAGGDVNGDGFADLVIGAGPGGGPRVIVVDGQTLLTQGPAAAVNKPMANFFAGNISNRSGVRVATKTLVGSLDSDVVTGDATGSTVTAYRGSSLAHGQADVLYTLDAFPGLNNGVFVG